MLRRKIVARACVLTPHSLSPERSRMRNYELVYGKLLSRSELVAELKKGVREVEWKG